MGLMDYIYIGLTYMTTGFLIAFLGYFIFKKKTPGKFWVAAGVAVSGAFIGGFLGVVFKNLIHILANLNNTVNIFPPLFFSIIVLLVYQKVSMKDDNEK